MRSDGRRIATVFGGAGFIGRYLVPHLVRQGFTVRIAGRDTEKAAHLKPMGNPGEVVPLYAPLSDAGAVARAIMGAEVVVNLVGILAEKKSGDFVRAHGTGPRVIADEASRAGVKHLVHISAIGASGTSRSGYGRSKAAGEASVTAGFPDVVILRPSIVFGPEDQFFNRFGAMARLSPVMPVISGRTKFQPVYVGDVAEAIMAALALPPEAPRLYELGGPEVLSFREILVYILKQTGLKRPLLAIPPGIARLQAKLLEHMPGKPFTTDQLEMLAQDNVTSGLVPGFAALGIVPRPIDLVVPAYLARYGGKRPNS
ncbi:complex I NDUFA9 subunit family protein [Acidisoma silvae]|uniref:Complex I NDUFA9 subunit family protein n=1 Tax=Acidisoma silvae TaxID=2802396 RepID=A0A963YT24_9PROT|nr:complex I NDUFA9 subunit family protein [Acidisoma silvae]MCB8876431.1 complex I NDUFA9 subunit family protein [Acidisoma silvae]